MKRLFISTLAYIICSSACTKTTTPTTASPEQHTSDILSGTRDNDNPESITPYPHTTSNQIALVTLDGQACNYTPIPGTWYISSNYLNQYVHTYQIDAKPEYPGNVLCGPTSYMLAAHMICAAKNHPYPSSKVKLGALYNALLNAGRFDNAEGMYISDIDWLSTNYDYPIVKTNYRRTSNRDNMKEFIEYHIKSGFPVIVTVDIFGLKGAYWPNDVAMTDQAGSSYYVSKNGPVGHFILLIGIKINADGSGTIWYKDPLSSTATTRSASYTRILDAMKSNGNTTYYDAVAVYE